MQIAYVMGSAISTVKHRSMEGCKLLVVQPLMMDGETADGDPQLAIDILGAGRGERVMLTSDGGYAREILNTDATPVRWATLGIMDE